MQLRPRFDAIAALDKMLTLYGARGHLWVLLDPLTSEEVSQVEARWGCPVPHGWRTYLLSTSAGGAGPVWGLRSPSVSASSVERLQRPFEGLPAVHARFRAAGVEFDDGYHEAPPSLRSEALWGTLPIADDGCGHHFRVVVHGEQAGSILSVSNEGGVYGLDVGIDQWIANDLNRRLQPLEETLVALESDRPLEEVVRVPNARRVLTLTGTPDTYNSGRSRCEAARVAARTYREGTRHPGRVEQFTVNSLSLLSWWKSHAAKLRLDGYTARMSLEHSGRSIRVVVERGDDRFWIEDDCVRRFVGPSTEARKTEFIDQGLTLADWSEMLRTWLAEA